MTYLNLWTFIPIIISIPPSNINVKFNIILLQLVVASYFTVKNHQKITLLKGLKCINQFTAIFNSQKNFPPFY